MLRVLFCTSTFVLMYTAQVAAGSDYGVPVEVQLWDTGRTPLVHMVDVSNEIGLKVLAEHNFLNDNNIAFSPYGLTGILVALYEGVDGDSSYQLQRGMQLPWNRNIMRVGFRDIHRTLKTYFVPEEGFLAGLALNNENVTFKESYKKVLRFYGFDLDNDRIPTLPPQTSNSTSTTNSSNPTTASNIPPDKDKGTTSTPEIEETTPSPTAAVTTPSPTAAVTDIDIRIPSTSSTPSQLLASNAESTPQAKIPEESSATPQVIESTVKESPEPTITTTSSITSSISSVTSQAPNTEETTVSTVTLETQSDTNKQVEILSTTPDIASSVAEESTESTVLISTETTPKEIIATQAENEQMTSIRDTTPTPVIIESTLETLDRKKKSIVDFIFTNPPYIQDINNYYRSFEVTPDVEAKYNSKKFLANGFRNIEVPYMQYDSVLEHAYLPHLEASALRLPLDSDRYYLLVVLPSREGPPELDRLIGRMARESDLRDVYEALRPKRIRALVPSFTVKGHITLTTDLQKLGIRDVFEPRQRDFSPMTSGVGVYVRSVEQAVSVAIRKYRPDDHKRNRYVSNRYPPPPLQFSATYPFLYFVMDSNIHVSLMAGKMVDPLNTRIL